MNPTKLFPFKLLAFTALLLAFSPEGPEAKAQQQGGTITGTITSDATGDSLPGVNVLVEGTDLGAATGADGTYAITGVEPGTYTVRASFIGYGDETEQDVEVREGEATTVDFVMQQEAAGLDEVVVVGYGEQQQGNLTGAVESVQGEELNKVKVTQTSSALQGLVPGLTVTRGSGEPGSGGTPRIRGIGTLGDSSPLVIVDGMQSSLDAVDPNNIESISVLKDAASAAIYGSRAANGVILIETKGGPEGGGVSASYDGWVGWQEPTRLPDYLGGYQYMTKLNEARENEGKPPVYSQEYINAYQENGPQNRNEYPNTDWQDAVLKNSALEQHHNLAVSGGTDRIRLRGSLTYMDQGGLVANTGYTRYGVRLNSNVEVSEKLDVSFDLHGRQSTDTEPSNGLGSTFRLINQMPPIYNATYSDGSWASDYDGRNPAAQAEAGGVDETTWRNATIRLRAKYSPIENATIEAFVAPDYSSSRTRDFRRRIEFMDVDTKDFRLANPQTSTLNVSDSQTLETTLDLLGRYSSNFGQHYLKGLLGAQRIFHRTDWFSAFRDQFALPDYQQLNAGSTENEANSGSGSEWGLMSYFGRLNYDYGGKYLFEANFRYDGSSRFAEGNRYGFFPSFSAGWRMSEEPFMEAVDFVDNLKLRASWGQLGNQEIGLYPYLSTVNLGLNYTFGSRPADGAAQTALANRDISWETTEMLNFGLDLGLWDDRLGLTADYYIKDTRDILLRLPLPATVGLTAPFQNAGRVKNVGWEMALTHSENLWGIDYNVRFNLSDVRNEVVDLADTGPYISGLTIIREGDPIDAIYGFEADRLFQSEEEVAQHAEQFGIVEPGDIRYVDQNGDGVVNAEDRVVLGNRIPRYTYGLTLNAAYQGFDLTMFFQGVGKRAGYLEGMGAWAFYNGGKIQQWHMDHWTPDNQEASYPRLTFNYPNNQKHSSYWMKDASYFRVKTLQLGYSLPASLLGAASVENLRVYANARDLFSVDNYRGFDPESPLGEGSFYPLTASYTLGVELTF